MIRTAALFLCITILLAGCSFQRQADAENARKHMVGLSKEEVLTCMGTPGKRTSVGMTEVWSYVSTNGSATGYNTTAKSKDTNLGYSTRSKSFCTVNIVMKQDKVSAVNYNGPRGDFLTPDEQCGYAVEHCVTAAE